MPDERAIQGYTDNKTAVIRIDEDACLGCRECYGFCPERAIGMVNGKAALLYPERCNGNGGCIRLCPMRAIVLTVCDRG